MRIEIRADSVTLDGYVNVPGRDSKTLNGLKIGKFIEKIEPGAFRRSLEKKPNIPILFNHLENRVLGISNKDNIKLYEDNVGLRCILTTSDPEIREKATEKKLQGWSFGFNDLKSEWTEENDIARRAVKEIDLQEVSLLDKEPAYLATSIEIRGGETIERRVMPEEAIETTILKEEQAEEETKEETKEETLANKKKMLELLQIKKEKN